MEKQYIKINDHELEVITPMPTPEPKNDRYDRKFIREQIKTIKADRDSYVEKRNVEIDECQAILDKMNELNIVEKEEEIIISEDIK